MLSYFQTTSIPTQPQIITIGTYFIHDPTLTHKALQAATIMNKKDRLDIHNK